MFIRTAVTVVCFILAGFFVFLGMEHMAGTIGLTPWAAFPFALGIAFIPVGYYEYWIEELECEIDMHHLVESDLQAELKSVEVCTCDEPHCSPCPQPYQEDYTEWHAKLSRTCQDPPFTCNEPWCAKCATDNHN